jgi:hypothetical protein
MWFFFLSTESRVEKLVPADTNQQDNSLNTSSSRYVGKNVLTRIPPFLALQVDVEDRRRMVENREAELGKRLAEFAEPAHMAQFGRPLWSAYIKRPDEMAKLAKYKLIGESDKYQPVNTNHVFAALSFRLSLDVCLQNPRTLPLARTAVNYFMRVVVSMDQDSGVLDTITPSEPILVKAAMEHLCEDDTNWPTSIRTLTDELLEKGLIQKGLKGELYSCLVFILAHDWVRWSSQKCLRMTMPKFVATFSVCVFLMGLYTDSDREAIEKIDPLIFHARMNFSHFVPAGKNLRPEIIPTLCRDLMRRQAAMQLAPDQPTYDLMFPCQIGDGVFKQSRCVIVVAQIIKNKIHATTPDSVFEEDFTKIGFKPSPPKRDPAKSIRN